jgi:serine/threonine protein kinase
MTNPLNPQETSAANSDKAELEKLLQESGMKLVQFRAGEGGSAYVHQVAIEELVGDLGSVGLAVGDSVAVKDFNPSALAISGQLDRIAQEIGLGKGLRHKNLVKVYGGYISETQTRCLLFMEWFSGKTLERWSEDLRRNCAWPRLRKIGLDLIAAVRELHGQNILHRDIKPENVMVQDERAILMDIGVAEITEDGPFTMHTPVKDFVGACAMRLHNLFSERASRTRTMSMLLAQPF